MAVQMQEIASANREMERSKIEVQLKIFSEQMEYQREKDRRMYENAALANENARLAILKQGEMVGCLAQLSTVLSRGLSMSGPKAHGERAGAGQHEYTGAIAPLYPGQAIPRQSAVFTSPHFGYAQQAPSSTNQESGTTAKEPDQHAAKDVATCSEPAKGDTTDSAALV